MAKEKTVYVCSNCGQDSPKWVGKCPTMNRESICMIMN